MQDNQKTKEELLRELNALRRRVAELAQAGEKIKQAAEEWVTTFDSISDLVSIQDKDFNIVKANKAFADTFKMKPEELIGKKCYEVVHGTKEPWPNCPHRQIFETRKPARAEFFEPNLGIHLEVSTSPIFNEKKEITGSVHITKDITERKKAEEALRQEKRRLEDVTGSVGCGLLLLDTETRVTYANAIAEKWFGPLGQIKGKTCCEVFNMGVDKCAALRMLKTGQTAQSETFTHTVDKEERFFYTVTSSVRDPDGKISQITQVVVDITEESRAAEALRESEENYRILVENQTDMVVKFDTDGALLFVSPSYCKTFGKSQDELIGSRFMPLIHEEDREQVAEVLKNVYKPPYTGYVEERALTKDGWRWQAWLNTGVLNNENRVEAIIGVGRDITERKQAEEKLHLYGEIITNMSEGVYAVRASDGVVFYTNPKFEEMFGYGPGELIGKHVSVVNAPGEKTPEETAAEIMKILNKQGSWQGEICNVKKDGVPFWCYASVSAFEHPEHGKVLVSTHTDITERKQAEEALQESEERFKTIFENIAVGVYRTTPDGRILMANPALVRMLGYSSFEELAQRSLEKEGYEPQYPRSAFKERIEKEGQVVGLESAWVRKDGTTLFIIENSRVVRDENGNTLYYEGTAEDITERKRAEVALHESEEKYRTLVESADEAIATIDKNGVFLFLNRRGAEGMGGEPKDYIGKTMWDAFPNKKVAERQAMNVRSVIKTGKGIAETAITELQGQQRWYETIIEPLRDNNGKVIAALVISRDVHEIRQAEEELGRYREEMVRAERLASLGTLSATLAHELMQPLTVIGLSIENSLSELEATSCPETVIEGLKDSLAEVSNVTSIAERFRNFARRSSGKSVSKVNLKVVAERIVKLLNKSAQHAQVTLDVKKGMDNLPPAYSNEKDIEQLFFALVQNAIQAADGSKPCKLIINGAVKGKRIELRFSDSCGGIEAEDLDKIFEPFFTTKPAGEGTGLGLCIVRRIAVRSGGGVRVKNKPGKGSTFVVTLGINRDSRP